MMRSCTRSDRAPTLALGPLADAPPTLALGPLADAPPTLRAARTAVDEETRSYAADQRTALSDLYRAEYRSLVRLACLLLDRRELAEEVVQDAFIRLDVNWDRVQDPSRRPAYLRSIVMNLARSRMRRRMVVRKHPPTPPPDAPPAEEGALLSEDRQEVVDALRTLSGRQRECLVLRFYEDLTDAQIAQTLGISVGAVKAHVHRGMAAMTKKLEARHG